MAIMVLPMVCFARTNSWKVRPFVGYEAHAAKISKLNYNENYSVGGYKDVRVFNRLYDGDIVFGAEFYDYVALSIKPNFAQSQEITWSRKEEIHKKNEVYADLDFYLAKPRSNIKPYISFNMGYMELQKATYLSDFGGVFMYASTDKEYSFKVIGVGAGCKYYVNKNFYLMTDLEYKRTIEDYPFRISRTLWNIGAGYRF